jgi:Gram-negative bacterial TonB protein C-terminal
MRQRVHFLLPLIFLLSVVCLQSTAAQQRSYPPFTLVSRSTEYDEAGDVVYSSTHTHYTSSSGDWRSVGKVGDYELATLYRRGKGVYQANSKTERVIKMSDHAPGCPLRTAAELRSDPKFLRTEVVLGFTAYVLSSSYSPDTVVESYFVPELGGGTPFKQVTSLKSGWRFVTEPVSVTLGEPLLSDITGPDYPVIEKLPIFDSKLTDRLISKPDAIYPVEALGSRVSRDVSVGVFIDEAGRVVSVTTNFGAPQSFRAAAREAAYQALFKPIVKNGEVVPARGYISYRFVPPE